MTKLMLTAALAAGALGLAACGDYDEEQNYDANAAYNTDESNYSDNAADYNMGDVNDMNAMDNGTANATENSTGNEAIDANTSY